MVKGIGAVRLRVMLHVIGNAQSAWQTPPDALRSAGLPTRIIDNLIELHASVSLDEISERIQAQNIQVLIWNDDDYPVRLHDIGNPPPVLYVRSSIETENAWSAAIVGARQITPYGRGLRSELL